MKIVVKQTRSFQNAYEIAKSLPEYFNDVGLKEIKKDMRKHILFGAYLDEKLVGFATFRIWNSDTIEISWLAVREEYQRQGVGSALIEKTLSKLSKKYKVCEVKTFSDKDEYEPYIKTRAFYKKMGFIPIETINQYPEWRDNPCQIFVKFLG